MASILGFILQRVGLGLQSTNPSAAMLTHRPAFTVHPGETGATAVRRLMAMAPDLLHFRGRKAFVRQPQPTDAVSYAFGTYHPVHHMRLAASAPDATRVQVFGAAGIGEAIAWREIPLVGERLRQVPRPQPGHSLAKSRSPRRTRILDRHQRDTVSGELQAPPNCRPRAPRHRRSPPPKRHRRHENARSRPRARLPSHRHAQATSKRSP